MFTYARAIHIYQNPMDLKETKCDVLISDGVIEHYIWVNHKHQKEIKNSLIIGLIYMMIVSRWTRLG